MADRPHVSHSPSPPAPAPALTLLAGLLGRAAAREWLQKQPGPATTDEPEAGTPGDAEAGR